MRIAPRFGIDGDNDGIIDEPNAVPYAHPASFRVDIDACNSYPTNATRSWSVAVTPTGNSCKYTAVVDQAHPTFTDTLTVTDPKGRRSSVTHSITFRGDKLVVSLGDSYASGEGNPDVAQKFDPLGYVTAGPRWADKQCHRSSANAAPARVAKALEDADATTTITFIHLACSGAGIEGHALADGGLVTRYKGADPCCSTPIPPQLNKLAGIVGTRRIDALMISIGGNDLGFGSIVKDCALTFIEDCNVSGSTVDRFNQALAGLPQKFDDLARRVSELHLRVDPSNVYLTEYPDPTADASGRWVSFPELLGGIDGSEAQWASQSVLASLNAALRAAATRHHWTYIGGVASQFRGAGFGHGVSAGTARWFIRRRTQSPRRGRFRRTARCHKCFRLCCPR